jgi:hypothetical protein
LTGLSVSVILSVVETITTRQAAERIAARLGRRVPISTLHVWIADARLRPVTKLPGTRGAFLFDPTKVDEFADALAAERAA